MGRVLAIDYGLKRTGIAVTDPLRIIASALTTVETPHLFKFLKTYLSGEQVDLFIIGEPKGLNDEDTHATAPVQAVMKRLQKEFPAIPVEGVDERYTSKMARQAMLDMGMKKMQRRDKGAVDRIAATIMLQEWLERH